MEDLNLVLKDRRASQIKFTEPPEIITDHTREIISFLTEESGSESGILTVRVLTVLGVGWDDVWKEALEKASTEKLQVIPEIAVFDDNLQQIKEYGAEKKVLVMKLGTDKGNNKLAELLEEGVDILDISNIGDWIGNEEVENLVEVIDEAPPPVIVFSGKESFTEFAQMSEGLEGIGYKVVTYETRDQNYEIRHQAIAYLSDAVEG